MKDQFKDQQLKSMNSLLELIRPHRAALYGFFSMMPKGGDLHHHYTGSIYAENYVNYVFQKDYYFNEDVTEVLGDIANLPSEIRSEWKRLSQFTNKEKIRTKLLRKWSVKDFVKGDQSSDEHFFSTFRAFSSPSDQARIDGLLELKRRAISQRLMYIETMLFSTNTEEIDISDESYLDSKLLEFQNKNDFDSLSDLLNKICDLYGKEIQDAADKHTKRIEYYHSLSQVDDNDFVLRFQNYVARYKQPIDVFVELFASFHSCDRSRLISGVNIVGAENGQIAMRDYWLHIMFFKFLENKYPDVKYSIHAGELVGGIVQPEYLGTHIRQALVLENVKRIGHGVDIIYDNDFVHTIRSLQDRNIVIEINLTSNEFILGISNDLHPVEIFYRNGIPIVICTDDEGVLRTSITEQYVILGNRYKLKYTEIKEIARNSIKFSHLEDHGLKLRLLKKLDESFNVFERNILSLFPGVVSEEVVVDEDAIVVDNKASIISESFAMNDFVPEQAIFGPLKFMCLTSE